MPAFFEFADAPLDVKMSYKINLSYTADEVPHCGYVYVTVGTDYMHVNLIEIIGDLSAEKPATAERLVEKLRALSDMKVESRNTHYMYVHLPPPMLLLAADHIADFINRIDASDRISHEESHELLC